MFGLRGCGWCNGGAGGGVGGGVGDERGDRGSDSAIVELAWRCYCGAALWLVSAGVFVSGSLLFLCFLVE